MCYTIVFPKAVILERVAILARQLQRFESRNVGAGFATNTGFRLGSFRGRRHRMPTSAAGLKHMGARGQICLLVSRGPSASAVLIDVKTR